MNTKLVVITEQNKNLLINFIYNMGNSSDTFRYFEKRDLNCLKNHLISYLFLEEEKPIGYGHLDKDGENVWLGVCIIQEKTGMGLGKKMMSYLIEFAKQNKISKILLSVDKKNFNAIKMYNKFGFCEKQKNEKIIFMELNNV
jgi:ribosomal protein S18 acetylase RimI-like enzyme